MITGTIDRYFNKYNLLHYYSTSHVIVKTQIKNLLEVPVIKWKYNVEPNIEMIIKIAKELYNNKSIIDNMLYLNYNGNIEKFECYKGLYLLEIINIICDENKKSNNIFGSTSNISWLYDQCIIISIRYNHSLDKILDTFSFINNKCIIEEEDNNMNKKK